MTVPVRSVRHNRPGHRPLEPELSPAPLSSVISSDTFPHLQNPPLPVPRLKLCLPVSTQRNQSPPPPRSLPDCPQEVPLSPGNSWYLLCLLAPPLCLMGTCSRMSGAFSPASGRRPARRVSSAQRWVPQPGRRCSVPLAGGANAGSKRGARGLRQVRPPAPRQRQLAAVPAGSPPLLRALSPPASAGPLTFCLGLLPTFGPDSESHTPDGTYVHVFRHHLNVRPAQLTVQLDSGADPGGPSFPCLRLGGPCAWGPGGGTRPCGCSVDARARPKFTAGETLPLCVFPPVSRVGKQKGIR